VGVVLRETWSSLLLVRFASSVNSHVKILLMTRTACEKKDRELDFIVKGRNSKCPVWEECCLEY